MRPIRAKSVLIRRKRLDPWFISRAGMNLYRGCVHDCAYCDGRSETYRVEGDFARDAVYKENAVDILTRELDPRRRRKPFRSGYLFLGGGISDSWQPAEANLRLTRRVLELIRVFPHPLLLLTKSDLILRDLELLKELNAVRRVTVAVSLSTVDRDVARLLEPGAAPPHRRLEVVRQSKEAGLGAGVMLLPIVPLITDSPDMLDAAYRAAGEAGADFVCGGAMTLKGGRQWRHFMATVSRRYPNIESDYSVVYGTVPSRWGEPSAEYHSYLSPLLHEIAGRHALPRRIPADLFPDGLTTAERASVMLDQMDGLLRERGLRSNYGRAARALAELDVPLEKPEAWKSLRRLGGIGGSTERIVKDIMDTGRSRVYERILVGGRPSD